MIPHSPEGHRHESLVVHQGTRGFLIHCPGCGRFQLGFGTFRLTQDREEVESFARLINRYYHAYQRRADRLRRDVPIESPFPGFSLLLSVDDLEQLNDLLQRSLLVLAARERSSLQ